MIADPYRAATIDPAQRRRRYGTASLHRGHSAVTPELMAQLGFIDEREYQQQKRRAKTHRASQLPPVHIPMQAPPAPRAARRSTRSVRSVGRSSAARRIPVVLIPTAILSVIMGSLLASAPHVPANEGRLARQPAAGSSHDLTAPMPVDATIDRLGKEPLIARSPAPAAAPAPVMMTVSAQALPGFAQPHSFAVSTLTLPQPTAAPIPDAQLQRVQRMIAAIPSLDPTAGGEVTSTFGYRTNPSPEYHRGLDLAQPTGHSVTASADGVVLYAGWAGGFGNKIEIDHGNGYATWYGHLSHIAVVSGQHVSRGDLIGAVGATGEATGPHLHYQIMLNGVAIDPMPYLHGVPGTVLAQVKTR